MKKSELKEVLKPLIKECIKEVIFEEGILSGLITEVAQGLSGVQPIVPTIERKIEKPTTNPVRQASQQLNEIKQQMQNAAGLSGIFEGTTPMTPQKGKGSEYGPTRGRSPDDAGVNIDGLVKMTGGWNQIK